MEWTKGKNNGNFIVDANLILVKNYSVCGGKIIVAAPVSNVYWAYESPGIIEAHSKIHFL